MVSPARHDGKGRGEKKELEGGTPEVQWWREGQYSGGGRGRQCSGGYVGGCTKYVCVCICESVCLTM